MRKAVKSEIKCGTEAIRDRQRSKRKKNRKMDKYAKKYINSESSEMEGKILFKPPKFTFIQNI